jgi:histone H3/H4
MQEQLHATDSSDATSANSKDSLLIASKVREVIRGHNCNTAGDALDGLNAWVHMLIEQATKRAQANGRKTIRAHDFMA